MKWLKGIIIFFVVLIVLLASGLAIASFYKKEILAEITLQLKEVIQADVAIGDADITFFADFPNVTLRLEDVTIGEPEPVLHGIEFFRSHRIYVNLITYQLLFKKIQFRSIKIEDGEVFIFRTASGHSNLDIFKKQQSTDTATQAAEKNFAMSYDDVQLQNIKFSYHDSLNQKFVDLTLLETHSNIVKQDSIVNLSLEGGVDFGRLLFNTSRGAFLSETHTDLKVNAVLNQFTSALELLPSTVKLKESAMDISGSFNLKGDRRIMLNIKSDNLSYDEGLTVIPPSITKVLSQMQIAKPFAFTMEMESFPGKAPRVDIGFTLKDNTFKGRNLTFSNLDLTGTMTNHIDDSRPFDNVNSMVYLKRMEGTIDGLPFDAEAKLVNFNDIDLQLHSKHKFELKKINRQVDSTVICFKGGQFVSEFNYRGKLNEYLNDSTHRYVGKLRGTASIENGSFDFVSRKIAFKDVRTAIRYTQDSVWIDMLSIASGKSSVKLDGLITKFIPFFVQPLEKGYVRMNITSPEVDLTTLLVKRSSKKKNKKVANTVSSKQRVSDMLDMIFVNLEFDVRLQIDKIKNGNFSASNVGGRLSMAGTTLAAKDVKMNYGGGLMTLNVVMKDLHKQINPVEVKAKLSNVRIKDLFVSFNNFKQKTIVDKNLKGTLSLNTTLRTKINDDFDVLLPTLTGDVDVVIKDGHLIDVAAFENVSRFLFKRRDFTDVKFAQISGSFNVRNRDLDVSRMEIQSSVLSLFLEGKYSLDDKTDLSIQIPLSNLKRRDETYVPQNVGVDGKVGMSVFLRAQTNEKGETELSYDPRRKRKEREKEKDKDVVKKSKGKEKKSRKKT